MKRLLAALVLVPCLALAQKLNESWPQQAVVENKGGASGGIGRE